MRRRAGRTIGVCAAAGLAVAAAGEPGAVLDLMLPEGRSTRALAALAAEVELAPDREFALSELGRDAHASHHVVAIRSAETPHRHDRHDLFVVILRGHGRMRIGAESRPVGEGSILYVPRGAVHAFTNESQEPAVAYAVYAPAFDGTDRVEEER